MFQWEKQTKFLVITPEGAGPTDANIISGEVTVRTETIYNLLSANSL